MYMYTRREAAELCPFPSDVYHAAGPFTPLSPNTDCGRRLGAAALAPARQLVESVYLSMRCCLLFQRASLPFHRMSCLCLPCA